MRLGAAWWVLVGAAVAAGCGDGGSPGSCPADLPASCPADAAHYQATIAPLVAERCTPCHEPGGQSAHYLRSYDEVFALRGPVLDQVYACKMPPTGLGYAPLSETERQEVLGWLVCGAPDD
jgi:hypothetical protein